jgi:tetratricopeptide (TPR) repeat protein
LLPSQGQYWHVKAKQAMSENLFEEAIEFFTKALQIREESKFYQNRGECYKWMKLYKLAL